MVGLYRHSLGDGFQSMCRVFFSAGMDGHNYINHLYRYNPLNNPCFDHTTYSTTYNWRYSMAVRHHMIIIHLSPQNWMHDFMRVAMNHNESPRLDGFIGGNDDVFGWSIYPLFFRGSRNLKVWIVPMCWGLVAIQSWLYSGKRIKHIRITRKAWMRIHGVRWVNNRTRNAPLI